MIGLFDNDPVMRTDRMTSGLAEFPGRRHLGFTCATQLVLCQRVQILGTRGRIEIEIPFNAPADAPTRILVDDGRDLSAAAGKRSSCRRSTSTRPRATRSPAPCSASGRSSGASTTRSSTCA